MAWAPDYITAELLKDYLRIDDAADDAFIALWITAVSRNIDDHCGRQFGSVTGETRTYARQAWDPDLRRWVTAIDDVFADPEDIVVAGPGSVGYLSDLEFEPENAVQRGRPWERVTSTVRGPLKITPPSWGWSAVPASVQTGILLQAARLAARRDSPFGIAGSPSEGSELRLLAQLDPDFRTTLKPYRRKWWAA